MPCESVYDPVEDDRGTVYMRGGERGEGERERERCVRERESKLRQTTCKHSYQGSDLLDY